MVAFFFDYTFAVMVVGTACLGLTAGALGAFVLLRNQGMLGDAISHAALPGTVGAFLLTHSANTLMLGFGGVVSALIGVCLIELIVHGTSLKKDVAIGVVLSVFFGAGLALLTVVQKFPIEGQALLHRLLFGNAATLTMDDLWTIGIVSLVVLLLILVGWKEFRLVIFDPAGAHVSGYSVFLINGILMMAIVAIMAVGLQMTGGVLMSTLLLAPAAAARQWTNKFGMFVVLSGLFGLVAAVTGSVMSALVDQLPTGPAIVVVAGVLVLSSLVAGKSRVTSW